MSNCAVCGKPVKSGIVVHSECWTAADQALDKPLTIEELRQMVGQPVWVETPGIREYGHYGIVAGVDIESMALYLESDFTCRDYGKTWIAYRRKPNEWISVKDRMPESYVDVLASRSIGMSVEYVEDDGVWREDHIHAHKHPVTHWIPLPAPPEVE